MSVLRIHESGSKGGYEADRLSWLESHNRIDVSGLLECVQRRGKGYVRRQIGNGKATEQKLSGYSREGPRK